MDSVNKTDEKIARHGKQIAGIKTVLKQIMGNPKNNISNKQQLLSNRIGYLESQVSLLIGAFLLTSTCFLMVVIYG